MRTPDERRPAAERERLRVLVLSPFAPRLDARHGGARVIAELLVRLGTRHRVALLHLREGEEPGPDEPVAAACELAGSELRPPPARFSGPAGKLMLLAGLLAGRPLLVSKWRSPAFAETVRRTAEGWRPDVVQVEYTLMAQYLEAMRGIPARRVLVVHEPQSVAASGRWAAALDARAWRSFTRRAAAGVDAIVTFTEADADAVRALAPAAPVTALPFQLTPSPEPLDPLGGSPPTVLFYGSFEHPPNVEAALRLATRIHPRVRERVPGARLALIGAAPPPQLVALASETVEVPGFVDDLRAAVARAAVLAAPLRLGGGMRVKVVEALAFGKALVASPLAIEGLAVSSGRELLVAETDDETADALGRVLSDPALRLRLAAAARAWAEREAARDWIRAVEALYGPEAERPIPLE